jgi:hypothetical protein
MKNNQLLQARKEVVYENNIVRDFRFFICYRFVRRLQIGDCPAV